jgi:hypothetical protein
LFVLVFYFVLEQGLLAAQAGLELLGSSDSLASISQVLMLATGMHHGTSIRSVYQGARKI